MEPAFSRALQYKRAFPLIRLTALLPSEENKGSELKKRLVIRRRESEVARTINLDVSAAAKTLRAINYRLARLPKPIPAFDFFGITIN